MKSLSESPTSSSNQHVACVSTYYFKGKYFKTQKSSYAIFLFTLWKKQSREIYFSKEKKSSFLLPFVIKTRKYLSFKIHIELKSNVFS